MKQYNFLQAIYMSFYSRDLYRDVVRNWGGNIFGYLLFILALTWVLMMIQIQPVLTHFYTNFAEKFFPQVPVMTIHNGEIKTPENRPYLIQETGTKKTVAIIDMSGKYKNLKDANVDVLITKTSVIYKDHHHTIKVEEIPKNMSLTVQPDFLKNTSETLVKWSWVILFPLLLLFSFLYRLIEAVFYAVLGKLFVALSDASLNYSQVFKLSIIAMTPAIFLCTIFDWVGIRFHMQWFFYFAVSMGYLIFGVRVNK